jgi:single-strand DNA-binding protein
MANICVFCGRAVKTPEVRYTQGEKAMCIARFSLAVERRGKDNGADYPNMIAFGKTAEFVEKHINKGTKVVICSHYQGGSYTNKDGQKVYTHDFVVDDIEFAESKAAASQNQQTAPTGNNINDYVNSMPNMEDLPFA